MKTSVVMIWLDRITSYNVCYTKLLRYAKPIREWRATWPTVYEQLLAELQQRQPGSRAIREFIRVLQLHQHYPADLIEQAVSQALTYPCSNADGVELCLRQLLRNNFV